jgi:hypothetical protein
VEDKRVWVVDIETIKSCFTYTGFNINTKELVQFVLHKDRNDLEILLKHLWSCKGHIGFNNINFDYPIIHYIMTCEKLQSYTMEYCIDCIYKEAQRIIEAQNKKDFTQFTSIRTKEILIPQLDLFKIWHYNNKARMCSLKQLQVSMNLDDVMEIPIHHNCDNITQEQIKEILEYNYNDVKATYEFYLRTIDKINLRKDLIKLYNIPLLNYNDVKIGESIFLKLLSENMKVSQYDLRNQRTYRSEINFSEIILPYIKYDDKNLQKLLEDFKNTTITQTKNGFKKSLILQNELFEYGQGGIHQCTKSGIYESDDDNLILDIDVASFYPNIAVQNKFRPEHLGEYFSNIYSDIYEQRSIIPKSDPRNGAFKLMLNGCFGKAGDENSFLFDNKFLLSITVNGQLLISLLIDKLLTISNISFIQSNTDGITIKFNKKYYKEVLSICKNWEELTNLKLEYVEYQKMVIRDVNNYLSIDTKGKIKYKGAFEVDKDYHKDNSFRIIPLALSNYFIKGIPVEDTIRNHDNIFDYCGRQKFKSDSFGTVQRVSKDDKGNSISIIETQHKITRYYITNKGGVFIKNYNKGSIEIINKGYQVTIYNKHIKNKDINEYDINYNFYISECYKIISEIENQQLSLF